MMQQLMWWEADVNLDASRQGDFHHRAKPLNFSTRALAAEYVDKAYRERLVSLHARPDVTRIVEEIIDASYNSSNRKITWWLRTETGIVERRDTFGTQLNYYRVELVA